MNPSERGIAMQTSIPVLARILSLTVVLSTGAIARNGTGAKMDIDTFLKQLNDQEHGLLSELENEKLWTDATPQIVNNRIEKDPSAQQKLLGYLRAAKAMRSVSLVPILARHITYSPYRGIPEKAELSVEQKFPAFVALQSIGIPAVSALLERLKAADPEDRLGEGQQTHNLAIFCLVGIYEQGGNGKELTRQRIESELEQTKGKARDFLLKALEHPALNPER